MVTHRTSEVRGWLDAMVEELKKIIDSETIGDLSNIGMIGIRSGGVDVGRYLHQALGLSEALGELNISFYRDDFSAVGLHPVVGPSNVPFDIDGRHIILVDDVLSTGRTVRAAMNEIFDYGRPSSITLAVLVQRSGHELPIRADVAGQLLTLPDTEHVSLDVNTLSVTIGARS